MQLRSIWRSSVATLEALKIEATSEIVPTRTLSPASPSGYLPTLDGWRAIAILGVLACHGLEPVFCNGGFYPNDLWYRLTRHGAFGVDIFFGLSGFLICTRLLQELHRTGKISLARFYIRRGFRILPPYLTYLLAIAGLGYSGVLVVHRWEWLSCLLFFRNYIASRETGWYLGHFWSLAVEEHFYLIWPSVLVFFGLRRARWAAALLALSVAGWRTLDFREQWVSLAGGIGFYGRTDIRLDALLWGCLAALLLDRANWRESLADSVSRGSWLVLLIALLCCLAYQPPLAMLWQAILVPMIVAGTVVRPASPVARLLEARPTRWIGRVSYSIYIWQQLFLVGSLQPRPLPLGILQQYPVNIIFVFAAASASYYVIERPFIKLGYVLSMRLVNRLPTVEAAAGLGVVTAKPQGEYAGSI